MFRHSTGFEAEHESSACVLGRMTSDRAKRFRENAEECRRIAATLPPEQKERLLQIAKAWDEAATAEDNGRPSFKF
jgi:hypothetical protein